MPWFNKEGFEDALFYSSLFFMLENNVDIPAEEQISRAVKVYETLSKVQEKSGYRFDLLLDILTAKKQRKKSK